MKTFSELISWELEQEKKRGNSLNVTSEEAAGKLNRSVLRRMKYLSSAGESGGKSMRESFGVA